MDQKEFAVRLADGVSFLGDLVWVADYRFSDIMLKPIRHVKPQQVMVLGNDDLPPRKVVYYSDFHFRPVGKSGAPLSKVIAPYDNTGFRSNTGGSLGIFLSEAECKMFYAEQCHVVLDAVAEAQDAANRLFDARLAEVQAELGRTF